MLLPDFCNAFRTRNDDWFNSGPENAEGNGYAISMTLPRYFVTASKFVRCLQRYIRLRNTFHKLQRRIKVFFVIVQHVRNHIYAAFERRLEEARRIPHEIKMKTGELLDQLSKRSNKMFSIILLRVRQRQLLH